MNNDIEQSLKVLHQGGLILYPTDTIWGIGCDATNEAAVAKVYALKQRDDEKSLIILLADERDLLHYVAHLHPFIYDFLRQTTKPTTVIYEGALNLPQNLVHADGTIAIRIVKEVFCKTLIKRFRKPIVSTSANISGQPAPKNFHEIAPAIRQGVDYVVQYRQDELSESLPSQIVKMDRQGRLTVLRS